MARLLTRWLALPLYVPQLSCLLCSSSSSCRAWKDRAFVHPPRRYLNLVVTYAFSSLDFLFFLPLVCFSFLFFWFLSLRPSSGVHGCLCPLSHRARQYLNSLSLIPCDRRFSVLSLSLALLFLFPLSIKRSPPLPLSSVFVHSPKELDATWTLSVAYSLTSASCPFSLFARPLCGHSEGLWQTEGTWSLLIEEGSNLKHDYSPVTLPFILTSMRLPGLDTTHLDLIYSCRAYLIEGLHSPVVSFITRPYLELAVLTCPYL